MQQFDSIEELIMAPDLNVLQEIEGIGPNKV